MYREPESDKARDARWAKYEKEVEQLTKDLEPVQQFTTAHLRARSREGYELSLDHIISIATGELPQAPYSSRIRAHEALGKQAMGKSPQVPVGDRELIKIFLFATAKFLGDRDKYHRWLAEVQAAMRYPR